MSLVRCAWSGWCFWLIFTSLVVTTSVCSATPAIGWYFLDYGASPRELCIPIIVFLLYRIFFISKNTLHIILHNHGRWIFQSAYKLILIFSYDLFQVEESVHVVENWLSQHEDSTTLIRICISIHFVHIHAYFVLHYQKCRVLVQKSDLDLHSFIDNIPTILFQFRFFLNIIIILSNYISLTNSSNGF